MAGKNYFLKGVIEGFYGRPWSFEARLSYATYLPLMGLDTYIYCPKSDPYLRKQWPLPWPAEQFRKLQRLSITYRRSQLQFGIGLSPFALYENYNAEKRRRLRLKIEQINALQAPVLAILFDDMPGNIKGLACRQVEIIQDVLSWTSATRVLVCPTYYSFDPVLEKYFGDMPVNYWQELGEGLPQGVDVLWTGNQVCSEEVTVEDIQAIKQCLGTNIVLWDNYPVNDGAIRSKFLYGEKLQHRDSGLASVLKGHLCNPMNQALMSLRALSGLGELYGELPLEPNWLVRAWGSRAFSQLSGDLGRFQSLGLEGLGSEECARLAGVYEDIPDAAAAEVAGWLRGEYAFDPSCLTD